MCYICNYDLYNFLYILLCLICASIWHHNNNTKVQSIIIIKFYVLYIISIYRPGTIEIQFIGKKKKKQHKMKNVKNNNMICF